MASQLAWLDLSASDQKRARELIAFFSQTESRDELGIGTIRDALSNAMFPGTSVIQTRARYFLFVPWLFREGERRGYEGSDLLNWVNRRERKLITALRNGGDHDGLLGKVAGERLKILPSTIYWSGLVTFGIVRRDTVSAAVTPHAVRTVEDLVDEMVDSDAGGAWEKPPAAPSAFFDMQSCDFDLTYPEANWLRERILAATPGTVLHFLVERAQPVSDVNGPWDDPSYASMPDDLRTLVHEAWRFSVAMHGAALLYNLLLVERAETQGLAPALALDYAELLAEWDEERRDADLDLAGWDLLHFWATIGHAPSLFVTEWLDTLLAADGPTATHRALRDLVARREWTVKKTQARLHNDRLLAQWRGQSATDRLTFRWAHVRTHLQDIVDGLAR